MDLEIKKGLLLIVKVPPFYDKEYFYEVTSAGDKLVRASLYNSPKVKKTWSIQELETLVNHGVVRQAKPHEKPLGSAENTKP